jgi:hypothetical protein
VVARVRSRTMAQKEARLIHPLRDGSWFLQTTVF